MRNDAPASRLELATARVALAQYLLFEATVESVSTLGERFGPQGLRSASNRSPGDLVEPYLARYRLYRALTRAG